MPESCWRKSETAIEAAAEIRKEAEAEGKILKYELKELRSDLERRENRLAEREQRLDEEARRQADRARKLAETETEWPTVARISKGRRGAQGHPGTGVRVHQRQARAELVREIENQAKREAALIIREIEGEARKEGEKRATKIVSLAVPAGGHRADRRVRGERPAPAR
ncbi:hypothetical protein GCM10018952_71500 [Streptosporangium vulgare]